MSIVLYLGCMFAGKTTELIREADRYSSIGKKVLMINHSFDNRYSDEEMMTHSRWGRKCTFLSKLPEQVDEDVIVVNEGQFFTGLVDFCLLQAEKYGKIVIVGALDGDYKREKFGEALDLVRYCDSVIKLKAYCKLCNVPTLAIFTKKISGSNEQIDIGVDQYLPVCRKHYLE